MTGGHFGGGRGGAGGGGRGGNRGVKRDRGVGGRGGGRDGGDDDPSAYVKRSMVEDPWAHLGAGTDVATVDPQRAEGGGGARPGIIRRGRVRSAATQAVRFLGRVMHFSGIRGGWHAAAVLVRWHLQRHEEVDCRLLSKHQDC